MEIYASESKKKRVFTYACQYLILYLPDEERSSFVEEICRGHKVEDTESGNTSYQEDEKEVTEILGARINYSRGQNLYHLC